MFVCLFVCFRQSTRKGHFDLNVDSKEGLTCFSCKNGMFLLLEMFAVVGSGGAAGVGDERDVGGCFEKGGGAACSGPFDV